MVTGFPEFKGQRKQLRAVGPVAVAQNDCWTGTPLTQHPADRLSAIGVPPLLVGPHWLLKNDLKVARRAIQLGSRRPRQAVYDVAVQQHNSKHQHQDRRDEDPQDALHSDTALLGNNHNVRLSWGGFMEGAAKLRSLATVACYTGQYTIIRAICKSSNESGPWSVVDCQWRGQCRC